MSKSRTNKGKLIKKVTKRYEISEDTDDSNNITSDNNSEYDTSSEEESIQVKKPIKKISKTKKVEKSEPSNDESEEDQSISSSTDDVNIKKVVKNIIFEDINDDYSYGKLGPFNVMIMNKNGYVNATKLCKDDGREYYKWSENKRSKELMKALGEINSSKMRPRIRGGYDGPFIKVNNTINLTRGTYVHPELIIDIACWCSPTYALKVNRIMIEYHAKEYIEEKDKMLKKKDDKIDKMSKKMDTMIEGNKELIKGNKTLKKQVKVLMCQNNKISKQNAKTHEQNEDIVDMLENITDHVVVPGKHGDGHMFFLIKNNDEDTEDTVYNYHVFRVMRKDANKKIIEHKIKHPNMTILLRIDHTPNSINLWNRVKTALSKKIEYTGCRVNLKKKYTQKVFVDDIKMIHNERFDYKKY